QIGVVARVVGRLPHFDLVVPVVHAVEVDAGGEEIRRLGQRERGEVPAVRAAPGGDAIGIDVGARAEIQTGADDVVHFARAARAVVLRLAELHAVADAAAVIHGQHDVAAAGQVLVHGVRVRVVTHVVPAEEHLPARAAVEEDGGGVM